MSNTAYHVEIPIVALMVMSAILVHISSQNQLRDRSSLIYRKLLLLSMLDIFFDFVSIVVPLIPGLHMPVLFNLLNGMYFQLNVYMLYTLYIYFNDLRDTQQELSRVLKVLTVIPGILSGVLLISNVFFHVVFWYDAESIYHTGPLYNFIYILAFLYIIASVVHVVYYRQEYSARKKKFMAFTIAILLVCITIQLNRPELLTIDLGISMGVLLFYLHNNNPVQYVDFMTGAFDKSYFDVWISEQMRQENEINLIAVRAGNLNEICIVQGDKQADTCMAVLAEEVKHFDHEGSVFRLSGNTFLIHYHDMRGYQRRMEDVINWSVGEECRRKLPGCALQIAGIPHAEHMVKEYAIHSYADYLYQRLKSADRNYIISNEEYLSGFRYDMEIERYVREAVAGDLFDLAFQPIYNLKKGTFNTVEVLTRLNHPAFGVLNTMQVVGIAEQNGLIDEITRLQVKRLCGFLHEHPEVLERMDRIKFNLSPYNMVSSEYITGLIAEIESGGLPLHKFEFEITESIATELSAELLKIIGILRERDIYLSLDDFGSGYSNLSNVLQLPFHSIKLDRSLILLVCESASVAGFYEGIVRIMQEYGLEIVCEGVETRQEAELLKSWGADMIQGYYYCKPLSDGQFLAFLNSNK